MSLTANQRRTLISNIVNQNDGFESDALNTLTDNQLVALARPEQLDKLVDVANAAMSGKPPVDDEEDDMKEKDAAMEDDMEEEDDEEEVTPTPPVKNGGYKNKKAMTGNVQTKQWWDEAPPEVRKLVANAQRIEQQQRQKLIAQITANDGCPLTANQLAQRSTEDLEVFAQFATANSYVAPVADVSGFDFSGLGEPLNTANSGTASKPLALPGADYMTTK